MSGKAAVAAVAEAAPTPIRPVCANTHGAKWTDVHVKNASIVINGGFAGNRENVAESLVFEMDGTAWRFVHLHKHARWLFTAVAGPHTCKGEINQVKILDLIRNKFLAGESGGTELAAVADDNSGATELAARTDDTDPMEALDDVDAARNGSPAGPGPCGPARQRRRCRLTPMELTMPKRPLCAGSEHDVTQTIHVLLKPNGNRQLYLRIDGLEWLLSYAADEHHFQGIVRQVARPTPAVAEMNLIEWEFNEHHWVATVVGGPAAGTTRHFNPKGLRFHQWTKMKKLCLVDSFLSKSNEYSRKMAAKELARLWCEATRKGEGQAFEEEWFAEDDPQPALLGYVEPSPGPSPKRQRLLDEWAPTTAVAGVRAEAERVADASAVAEVGNLTELEDTDDGTQGDADQGGADLSDFDGTDSDQGDADSLRAASQVST